MSAHKITKGLWLGDAGAAADENFIKKARIRAIVNATNTEPCLFSWVYYCRVPIDDPGPGTDPSNVNIVNMSKFLPDVVEWIHRFRVKGVPVLVHCRAGAQRSATIVAAYLYKYGIAKIPGFGYISDPSDLSREARARKLKQVVKYIVVRRPVAFFGGYSINFLAALEQYAEV